MSFNISEFDKKDFKSGGNVFGEAKLFELAKLVFLQPRRAIRSCFVRL